MNLRIQNGETVEFFAASEKSEGMVLRPFFMTRDARRFDGNRRQDLTRTIFVHASSLFCHTYYIGIISFTNTVCVLWNLHYCLNALFCV